MDSHLKESLKIVDPEIFELCQREKRRQVQGLEMIASENVASKAVLEALSSSFHNKYSEGQVKARYYGGNEVVDDMEMLCQARCLAAFKLDPERWGVNVQPYSGSPANLAVYTGIVGSHGRIMGLDLADGGHLTHGFQSATRKVSATSLFFESMPYKVSPETGLIDYDQLATTSRLFRPQIIIAGTSCYPRSLDYRKFREIADACGCYLMSDMAHISGLVAAGIVPSPFEYSDIVTSTTHKTLRGPRAGIIFYRKGVRKVNASGDQIMYDLEKKINEAVFPGLQGGPHNNTLAAIAVAMKLASEPSFVEYQKQVLANCRQLCESMKQYGYEVVTGGSDNHMCLVNLRAFKLEGAKVETLMDRVNIVINKNTCPGDKNALRPSGIRLGTPALTSRGLKCPDLVTVADFLHRSIQLTLEAQTLQSKNTIDCFKEVLNTNNEIMEKILSLKAEVLKFSESFDMPGIDEY